MSEELFLGELFRFSGTKQAVCFLSCLTSREKKNKNKTEAGEG